LSELSRRHAGATAAKVAARAVAAKALAGDVAKGAVDAKAAVVQRADGRVEVKLPAEPPVPPVGGGQAAAAAGPAALVVGVIKRRFKAPTPPSHLTDHGKALWKNLYERFGPKIIDSVTHGIADDAVKTEASLGHLDKIATNLESKDWAKLYPEHPERWLDNDDKVRAVLRDIFVANTKPGRPLSNPKFDRQVLLKDLAEISELKGCSTSLGSLTSSQNQIRGNVAEITAAAADKRAGKTVEDINITAKVTLKDGTVVRGEFDLISDGTVWQIKVGGLPASKAEEAAKLAVWTEKAIALARSQGKTKVGYRFDKESMARYDSDEFQKLLADIRKKNPDITFTSEKIDAPSFIP